MNVLAKKEYAANSAANEKNGVETLIEKAAKCDVTRADIKVARWDIW
jgi:hypothetical protein